MQECQPAKILFLDIETAPNLGWVWGKWEQNVIEFERDWYILSYAFKWADQKKIAVQALPDFPGYKPDAENDKALCKELWKLLDAADIIVAHNGDRFDLRKANARFIAYQLPPPSPYKSIDTLKIARRHFKFDSNKLDDLGGYLHIGRKLQHTGKHLWLGCMRGDPKAWAVMRRYNAQDVALLEKVYNKLRPWAKTHPNLSLISRKPNACPVCQGDKLIRNGRNMLRTGYRQNFLCKSCSHQFYGGPIQRYESQIL